MNYYFIFYLNLSFSALQNEQIAIIDICLSQIISLAKNGFKFGIQISGISLEIIKEHRPEYLISL